MTLFGLVYDLCLHAYALASLPKMLLHPQKYKDSFWSKLGFGFPHIHKNGQKLIWIHAVSLGETKAISPLVKRLKALTNPPLILLSTTTKTGYAEGKKSAPMADFHVYLPFDFSYIIRRIVKQVAPDMVVLTETDFWYHFQDAAKRIGAQLVVVNGKISERSFKRLNQLPLLAKHLLHPIDHFFLQGELYKTRFAKLHIAPSKLSVTGNIKLDSEINTIDVASFKQKLGLLNQPVLTLGSTHDPEERIWISTLKQLWKQFPDLRVLIVPRHPERFNTVAHLLDAEHIPYARWSQNGTLHTHSALLVDAMGVLKTCYQISDLAFVGGSLTSKVGGHNILEPAFYGKPVLFGPYMYGQPDLLDLATSYKAGLQISTDTLLSTLQCLLSDPAQLTQLGANGLNLINSCQGALDKTYQELLSLLQKNTPC